MTARFQLHDLSHKYQEQVSAQLHGKPPARGKLPHPQPEHHQAPTLGGAVQGEAESVQRVVVRFTGHRVRPLDPDNFAGGVKDLLDGLRHASLLEGDEPWRIRLETEQVKVAHFNQERTVIELIYPQPTEST